MQRSRHALSAAAAARSDASLTPMFPIHIGCFVPYADYSPEGWGPAPPLAAARYAVPMPTLFSTEGYKFKKPSLVELVLYNMAALLGGVAAGYDVRVSNVSPLHPTLQPRRSEQEGAAEACALESYGFAHNTYHGPARHLRAPLSAVTGAPVSFISSLQVEEQKPIRFTDSPASGGAGAPHSSTSGLGTTPSPRRASAASAASDQLADLYHNYRENFPPSPSPAAAAAPAPAPAVDYYYRPADRTADYVVKHPYCGYDECSLEFREVAHRRTPSNSSASNSYADEFSPSRQYRGATSKPPPDYPRKQRGAEWGEWGGEPERPAHLGLELAPTRLRSSLKKYKKGGSGPGTPTNPTPPDSLASETDSSYASARDASGGSASRVRFSPEALEPRHA